MLKSGTKQIDTTDTTTMKRARKKMKQKLRGDKIELPPVISHEENMIVKYWNMENIQGLAK